MQRAYRSLFLEGGAILRHGLSFASVPPIAADADQGQGEALPNPKGAVPDPSERVYPPSLAGAVPQDLPEAPSEGTAQRRVPKVDQGYHGPPVPVRRRVYPGDPKGACWPLRQGEAGPVEQEAGEVMHLLVSETHTSP